MKKAAAARSRVGATRSQPPVAMPSAMSPREVVPATRAMAKMDSSMVGSTMEDMYISLLDPMPPNAEPVSRAASAMKNRIMDRR
ncbi:MAG: hypothetical protein A4E31_00870 [Methanomassiliicoccales archaeon PtaU1.Bin030]|nr:MAG: hypothetical protein A4E31_00870 [Methanomassiliicoccales archaeon PtaU1.Bin030]